MYRWATSSYDEARTFAAAATVLRTPVRLESALAVEWREAVRAGAGPGSWERLLAPPLPPAICLFEGEGEGEREFGTLGESVRALDLALRRQQGPAELEKRLAALRGVSVAVDHPRAQFVLRYNLARGYLAAGDAATAAEVAEPIFDGYLDRRRLPVTNASLAAAGGVDGETAALGFHARFLAGSIAYQRGEVAEAIKHFRLAINALNHVVAEDSSASMEAANYRRILVVPPGGCAARDEALTSLDAYAALVAAYMAAPEFTDPTRLPPEVRRTRLQIDPDDPFRPVLRFASTVASRPRSSPIPENLLWAASNLQRVYHYNRLSPDARLAVTRAVLLLRLTSDAKWVEALSASGDTDVCAMLTSVATQLERDAAARMLTRERALPTDSAQAAVAIHTVSRIARDCGRDRAPALRDDVRSVWLRYGRTHLGAELPGLYEEMRTTLEEALRPANTSERAIADAVSPILERTRVHARAFARGRVPGDLPAAITPGDGRRFVVAWRRAVFEDLADVMADAGSASTSRDVRTVALAGAGVRGGRVIEIPAGRAQHFLAGLNSAIAHAGLRPSQVYAPGELARLARAGGGGALLEYRARYAARSYPAAALAVLAAAFALAAAALLWVHIAWWRYRLLMGDRLYSAEARTRRGEPGDRA